MLARLGFVASVLTEGLSTSRTCRLRNATGDRTRELICGMRCTWNQSGLFAARGCCPNIARVVRGIRIRGLRSV